MNSQKKFLKLEWEAGNSCSSFSVHTNFSYLPTSYIFPSAKNLVRLTKPRLLLIIFNVSFVMYFVLSLLFNIFSVYSALIKPKSVSELFLEGKNAVAVILKGLKSILICFLVR